MKHIALASNSTAIGKIGKLSSIAALCASAVLVPDCARAADWEIDPVRIELSQEQQTAAITLKNTSDRPTSIQIQVVAWSQVDGKDVYTASRELMVSPPIVTISPKGEQVVRAALRRPVDANHELSYRIILQELPPAPVPGVMGVNVAMHVGLPVFVESMNGKGAQKIAWQIQSLPDNQLKVRLQNDGNAHVQISDLALYLPDKAQAVASDVGATYIMAGQSHEWLLKSAASTKVVGTKMQLKAFTDAGDIDTQLVLCKP